MAVGDLYRVAAKYTIDGQLNVNVFYMKNESYAPADDAQKSAVRVGPFLRTAYAKYLSSFGTGLTIEAECNLVSRLSSDQGAFPVTIAPYATTEASFPSIVACCATLRTGLAGPTRRGRVFLGGITVNSATAGQINATGITRMGAWLEDMAAAFMGENPTSGFRLGVFSRKRYEVISNPFDDYWKPVNTIGIRPILTTMKTRKIGVGA